MGSEGDLYVVGGVAAGGLGGVEPGGWFPVRDAVEHDAGPALFVEFSVVVAAEQCEAVDVSASAVLPGGDVVQCR